MTSPLRTVLSKGLATTATTLILMTLNISGVNVVLQRSALFIPLIALATGDEYGKSVLNELNSEMHDVDDPYEEDTIAEIKLHRIGKGAKQQTLGNKYRTKGQPQTRSKQREDRFNLPISLDRFAREVVKEVVRRFQWNKRKSRRRDHNRKNSKERKRQDDSIVESFDSKSSPISIHKSRRVGAWCPPPEDDNSIDTSVAVCFSDAPKGIESLDDDILSSNCKVARALNGDDGGDEVQPGMVLYVLSASEVADTSNSAAVTVTEVDDSEYEIEDDEPHKVVLNAVDNVDKDDTIRWDGSNNVGHEIELRVTPKSEAETLQSTSYYLPGTDDTTENIDQQVSFRWSSWVTRISQLIHSAYKKSDTDAITHGNTEDCDTQQSLYEEAGKHAFAGGSHGEIWRARRHCPTNTTNCDDGKEYIVKRLKIEHGYFILEAGLREVYFGELLAREVESTNLFTTYIDHFFREGNRGQLELWIVFERAGPSLRSYMYTPVVDATGGFVVFQHSAFWRRLRRGIGEGTRRYHGHAHTLYQSGVDRDEALSVDVVRPQPRAMKKSEEGITGEFTDDDGDDVHQDEDQGQDNEIIEGRMLLMEVLRHILTSVAFLHERGIVHR
eukprot:scaffold260_cov213-Alexandrium_tamarense.AAC.9